MRYTIPDYYKKFDCLAGACPATCCAGWQIMIDERSIKKYRNAKGDFGNRLKNSVDFEEQTFLQYDKRCAFLNEENLCDMHIEAGGDMMCATCRKYPRHIEVFLNEREISLSMSCPAVAKLIMSQTEKAHWKTAEDSRQDKEDDDFDDFLYSALQDSRSLMIEILQDRNKEIHLRMAMVLALANDIQNRINSRNIFDISNVCDRYQKGASGGALRRKLEKEKGEMSGNMMSILKELEVLNPSWRRDVERWGELILSEIGSDIPETELEQMVVYYLYTYYCGAVYDGDVLAKVKMAVVSTLLWEEICKKSAWEKNGELTFEERIRLAWDYSRELEHSDPNLNKMEELMNEREEVELKKLLAYLVKNVL